MKEKKCKGCGYIKPMETGFYKAATTKDGRQGCCKVCVKIKARAKAKEKHHRNRPERREFTETEKIIFRLGVLEGEKRSQDIQRAVNIQQRANIRLFEVIQDMDKREGG